MPTNFLTASTKCYNQSTPTWTVNGAGYAVGYSSGTADQFNFASTPFNGNGSISADLTSFNDPYSATGRAIVMMRANNTPGSIFADMEQEPGGTMNFYWRSTENGNVDWSTLTGQPLEYLKVTCSGNSFSGYYSSNGTTWTQLGSTQTLAMPSTILAGLGVGSHDDPQIATATFTHVAVTAGLTDSDIGSPGDAGSASFDNYTNAWTVNGGGSDISGTSDAFNYNYETYSGDGTIVARVDSVQNTNAWAKAGVMFRNDTTAGSANVAVFVTPGQGVTMQYRSTAGGSTSDTAVGTVQAPQWVKLVRAGNNFTGYYSIDGVNWTQIGSTQTISLNTSALAGQAVTAHNNSALCTAVLDNFSINSSLGLSATPTASSSLTTGGWGIADVNDGQDSSVSGDLGWSSNNSLTTNHEEWLQMDLGLMQPISQVVLYPRNDSGNVGYGFPINFTIQVSLDGVNWTTVTTETNYAQPTSGAPQVFTFPTTSARYVKVDGTSLRSNPNDSGYYRMQFAEMQVF